MADVGGMPAPVSLRLEDMIDPAKDRVRLVPGFATGNQGEVAIGGVPVGAYWMAHVDAVENDPVWVLVTDRPDTTSRAVVIGVSGPLPGVEADTSTPLYGTVSTAPTGASKVGVSTSAGSVEAAFGDHYSPQVSDKVRLLWQDGNAWILGKSAVVPSPPVAKVKPKKDKPGMPSPPGKSRSGVGMFTAADSGTWSTGTRSWNSYFGKDVYQGSYGSAGSNRGAWFYHKKPSKLRGKAATRVQIYVPRRHSAGNFNQSVTLHLYLHSSDRKPGGDVGRGASTTVTVGSRSGGGWKDLPTSWGSYLTDKGYGVGMAGGAYAGFDGVRKSSKSGQLRITWEG